jgi:hypothetical protein
MTMYPLDIRWILTTRHASHDGTDPLDSRGWECICTALQTNSSLTYLDASKNKLGRGAQLTSPRGDNGHLPNGEHLKSQNQSIESILLVVVVVVAAAAVGSIDDFHVL